MSSSKSLPHVPGRNEVRRILAYFTALLVLSSLASPGGGLAGIPFQFLLKEKLHLSAERMAFFGLVLAIPTYLGLFFGFVRDRWSPFGLRDRGYLLTFTPLAFVGLLLLAFGALDYDRLLALEIGLLVCYMFIGAAITGILVIVGQEDWISGRLSTVVQTVGATIAGLSAVLGGWADSHIGFRSILLIVAALNVGLFSLGLWNPRAVFTKRATEAVRKAPTFGELRRLARHWPVYPAALIWLLWAVSPAGATALLFYMTDKHGVAMSEVQYGTFNMIVSFSFVPFTMLYGWLCKRQSLRRILLWSTILGVPQYLPLLFIHSPTAGLWLAPIFGITGGVCSAAFYDLLIRSAPEGLEASSMAVAGAGASIVVRFGDVFGTWLYRHGGFTLDVWITTAMYALMVPILFLVPRYLTRHKDAEVVEETPSFVPEAIPEPA